MPLLPPARRYKRIHILRTSASVAESLKLRQRLYLLIFQHLDSGRGFVKHLALGAEGGQELIDQGTYDNMCSKTSVIEDSSIPLHGWFFPSLPSNVSLEY